MSNITDEQQPIPSIPPIEIAVVSSAKREQLKKAFSAVCKLGLEP